MHHLILNNFIFKPVDTWQQYGIYVGCAGGALIVLKAIWQGMKFMGNAFYNWRKGKDKDLQRELETGREAQTNINMNDQINARPPVAVHRRSTARR